MLAIYCLRLDWFGRVLVVASRVEDGCEDVVGRGSEQYLLGRLSTIA